MDPELANEAFEENFYEAFQEAWMDIGFRNAVAKKYLEPLEYWLYCKEDAQDEVDQYEDNVYSNLLERAYDCEGSTNWTKSDIIGLLID